MAKPSPLRYLCFVALNTALTSGACCLIWRWLPFLANEPPSLLFWPMTVISLPTFTLLYPILRQRPHPLARAAAFYLAFLSSLVLYGSYLWLSVPSSTAMMIVLALLAGHWYGLPFLAFIWFLNRLLSPLLL